jgi:NAD(P)-dependent dehydrogenase (short-subunit alcohol dehydrogenase family)
MNLKRALVTGVGPGTGLSVVRRLAAGGDDREKRATPTPVRD